MTRYHPLATVNDALAEVNYPTDTLLDGVMVVQNATEMASALTIANSAGSGIIKVPPGTTITKPDAVWYANDNITIDARDAIIDFSAGNNAFLECRGALGTTRTFTGAVRPQYTLQLSPTTGYGDFTAGTWVLIEDTVIGFAELNRVRIDTPAGGLITLEWSTSHDYQSGSLGDITAFTTDPSTNIRLLGGTYLAADDTQYLIRSAGSNGIYNLMIDGLRGKIGSISLNHGRNVWMTRCNLTMANYHGFYGCNNIILQDCHFIGNATTTPSQFIRMNSNGGRGFVARSCTFENCSADAIVAQRKWLNARVEHCQFINLGYGLAMIATGPYSAANQSWRFIHNGILNVTGEYNGTPVTSTEVNAL